MQTRRDNFAEPKCIGFDLYRAAVFFPYGEGEEISLFLIVQRFG